MEPSLARTSFVGPPIPADLLPPEPTVDETYEMAYVDDDVAVVSKSGDMPCHPSGRYRTHTLEHVLREKAGFDGVHFVSRLDRETSGCVLVARSAEAASRLGKDMMASRIRKEYLCIVRETDASEPIPTDEWLRAEGWIWPVGDAEVFKYRWFTRTPEAPTPDRPGFAPRGPAQSAATELRVLPWETFGVDPAPGFRLIHCRPITGRTHQIRATLRGLGYEVVGDKLYGPDPSLYARMCEDALTDADRAALGMRRQALHAWKLSFRHPATREDLSVEASLAAMLAEFEAAGHSSDFAEG